MGRPAALVFLAICGACTRIVDVGSNDDAAAPGIDASPAPGAADSAGDGALQGDDRTDDARDGARPPAEDGGDADADGSVVPSAEGGSDAGAADAVTTGVRFVFVTRSVYSPNMGGIAGADLRCQSSASAAGLAGTFRAWISDSNTDAKSRIRSDGPWLEVGTDRVLFPTRASIEGYPEAPLARDEYGDPAPEEWWTGTAANGLRHPRNCRDWTTNDQASGGLLGGRRSTATGRPGIEWTESSVHSCIGNELNRRALLCFGD
jgi:hypothetical protein